MLMKIFGKNAKNPILTKTKKYVHDFIKMYFPLPFCNTEETRN